MLIWWNGTQHFLKDWLEAENEFEKFAVAVEKCDVVVGHLSLTKTDLQKLFHLIFVGAIKTLGIEWALVMWEDSKYHVSSILTEMQNNWEARKYFTNIIMNISFLFCFLRFFNH